MLMYLAGISAHLHGSRKHLDFLTPWKINRWNPKSWRFQLEVFRFQSFIFRGVLDDHPSARIRIQPCNYQAFKVHFSHQSDSDSLQDIWGHVVDVLFGISNKIPPKTHIENLQMTITTVMCMAVGTGFLIEMMKCLLRKAGGLDDLCTPLKVGERWSNVIEIINPPEFFGLFHVICRTQVNYLYLVFTDFFWRAFWLGGLLLAGKNS